MKKLIILNHKMNLEYDEVYPYIEQLNQLDIQNNIVVCPTTLYLENFSNHCNWGVGAQDVDYRRCGNYTGAVSTIQLKSLGVEYVLLGHYERKKYYRESNKLINKKLKACLDSNLIPILCFGETGNRERIVQSLEELLEGVENIHFIIFAYEPLELSEIKEYGMLEEDIHYIYDYLYQKYHVIPNIVYGGGVVLENIRDILKMDKLNGVLIGGMSANLDKIRSVLLEADK